jgi:hypothetical protein
MQTLANDFPSDVIYNLHIHAIPFMQFANYRRLRHHVRLLSVANEIVCVLRNSLFNQ